MTLWTVACQASLSMEFPRQEYRSGLPFPSPGDLPDPGIEPVSPALQADSSYIIITFLQLLNDVYYYFVYIYIYTKYIYIYVCI